MIFLLIFLLLLKQVRYASSTPLGEVESQGSLVLSQPGANSTYFNSTTTGELTVPGDPVPFPIENSTITLFIYNCPNLRIDKIALRNMLFDAYSFVSNLIDIAGDGYLPASSNPYKVETEGALIRIINARKTGPGGLKWSNVRDVLLGLREYMVLQGHSFHVSFAITQEEGAEHLGSGRVLGKEPIAQSII